MHPQNMSAGKNSRRVRGKRSVEALVHPPPPAPERIRNRLRQKSLARDPRKNRSPQPSETLQPSQE